MAAAKRGIETLRPAAVYTIRHFFLGMVFGGLCKIALGSAQSKGGKGSEEKEQLFSISCAFSCVGTVLV